MFQDKKQDKNVVKSQDNSVKMYQDKNVKMFQGNSARLSPESNVKMFQDNSVGMSPLRSAAMFPDRSAGMYQDSNVNRSQSKFVMLPSLLMEGSRNKQVRIFLQHE